MIDRGHWQVLLIKILIYTPQVGLQSLTMGAVDMQPGQFDLPNLF